MRRRQFITYPVGSDRLGEGVCAENRGDYDQGEFKESDAKAKQPDF
jgi:hypothetical protein